MHKYLLDHPSFRRFPVDFTELRDLVEKFDNRKPRTTATKISAKSSASKGKGKATQREAADNDDNDNDNDELTGEGNDSDHVKRTKLQKSLHQLGITQENFLSEVDKIRESMKKFPFTQNERTTPHYGTRVVTTGGLTWNPESKKYKRDWATVAIVSALEVTIVGKYRASLLNTKNCQGACVLRGIFAEKLREKTQPNYTQHPVTGEMMATYSWTFPDNIEVTDGLDVVEVANVQDNASVAASKLSPPLQSPKPSQQRKIKPRAYDAKMVQARVPAQEVPAKEPKLIVAQLVSDLENNRYLHSFNPGVPPRTLETMAHVAISMLARVRLYTLPSSPPRLAHKYCTSYSPTFSCFSNAIDPIPLTVRFLFIRSCM